MQVSTQIVHVYKNYIGMLLSNPYIVTKGLVLSNMQGTYLFILHIMGIRNMQCLLYLTVKM